MRIRITSKGIFGSEGEIPVGTEFDVSHEPTALSGRYEVVSAPAAGAEMVVNPAADAPRRGRPRKDA